jgi:hypothetical protein
MVYYTHSAVHQWCTAVEVGWEMKDTDTRIASRYSTRHVAADTGCSATAVNTDRMAWTQLGVRMGFTRDENQREEILDDIFHMAWARLALAIAISVALQHAPSCEPSLAHATGHTESASPDSAAGAG